MRLRTSARVEAARHLDSCSNEHSARSRAPFRLLIGVAHGRCAVRSHRDLAETRLRLGKADQRSQRARHGYGGVQPRNEPDDEVHGGCPAAFRSADGGILEDGTSAEQGRHGGDPRSTGRHRGCDRAAPPGPGPGQARRRASRQSQPQAPGAVMTGGDAAQEEINRRVRVEIDRAVLRNIKGLEFLTSPKQPVGAMAKDTLLRRGTLQFYRYRPVVNDVYRIPLVIVSPTSNRGLASRITCSISSRLASRGCARSPANPPPRFSAIAWAVRSRCCMPACSPRPWRICCCSRRRSTSSRWRFSAFGAPKNTSMSIGSSMRSETFPAKSS